MGKDYFYITDRNGVRRAKTLADVKKENKAELKRKQKLNQERKQSLFTDQKAAPAKTQPQKYVPTDEQLRAKAERRAQQYADKAQRAASKKGHVTVFDPKTNKYVSAEPNSKGIQHNASPKKPVAISEPANPRPKYGGKTVKSGGKFVSVSAEQIEAQAQRRAQQAADKETRKTAKQTAGGKRTVFDQSLRKGKGAFVSATPEEAKAIEESNKKLQEQSAKTKPVSEEYVSSKKRKEMKKQAEEASRQEHHDQRVKNNPADKELRNQRYVEEQKAKEAAEKSKVKPEEPKVKPEEPKVKPEEPKVKPEEPKVKPEEPKVKPEEPKVKPEEPKVKPEEPKVKPEEPKVKPEEPKVKPEEPKVKPEEPKVKPEGPKVKPKKAGFFSKVKNIFKGKKGKIGLIAAGVAVLALAGKYAYDKITGDKKTETPQKTAQPAKQTKQTQKSAQKTTQPAKQTPQTKPTPEQPAEEKNIHNVVKGDNLWNIAKQTLIDKHKGEKDYKPSNAEILRLTEKLMDINNKEYKKPLPADSRKRVVIIHEGDKIRLA